MANLHNPGPYPPVRLVGIYLTTFWIRQLVGDCTVYVGLAQARPNYDTQTSDSVITMFCLYAQFIQPYAPIIVMPHLPQVGQGRGFSRGLVSRFVLTTWGRWGTTLIGALHPAGASKAQSWQIMEPKCYACIDA